MSGFVSIRPDDPTPPYEQLRRQIAFAISAGQLTPGTRLPTVRQLAGDLGVATGTVMRAYAELEASGQIRTRRGAGSVVADSSPNRSVADRLAALTADYVASARALGADDAAIAEAIEKAVGPRP